MLEHPLRLEYTIQGFRGDDAEAQAFTAALRAELGKQLKCEIRNHPRCGVLIEISRYDPFNVDMVEMFTRGWVASALHTPRLPSIKDEG